MHTDFSRHREWQVQRTWNEFAWHIQDSVKELGEKDRHRARQGQNHVGLVSGGEGCGFYLNDVGDYRGSSGRHWHDVIHIVKHQ